MYIILRFYFIMGNHVWLWEFSNITAGRRASFHTRRLGLMNLPDAAEHLEGLGAATIPRSGCRLTSSSRRV